MFPIHFAYAPVLFISVPVVCLIAIYRWGWYKPVAYRYPLTALVRTVFGQGRLAKCLLYTLRAASLVILAFLVAKPQLVDTRSKMPVKGIDIMLVLDISGSMMAFDDLNDPQPRLEVAKKEALRFIAKRPNDAIGLVLFGKEAVARAPLTHDKNILSSIIKDLQLGLIDHTGTVLAKGIAIAANRLKDAQGTSKIMIVLTDGEPTKEDIDPSIAVGIAQRYGIKVYTVGIGADQGGYLYYRGYGAVPAGSSLNRTLLKAIAQKTGGQYFEAKNPNDMAHIYDTIDQLEATEREVEIFTRYHDIFVPWIWLVLALLLTELLLASFKWVVL